MKSKKLLSISIVSLFSLAIITGCNAPNASTIKESVKSSVQEKMTDKVSESNSSESNSTNQANTTSQTTTNTNVTTTNQTALTNVLADILDSENVFNDSEFVVSSNFNTKAFETFLEGVEAPEGGVAITTTAEATLGARAQLRKDNVQARKELAKAKREANKTLKKEKAAFLKDQKSVLRAELVASGAITENEDGTVTIDKEKAKEAYAKFKVEVKAELKIKKEAAQEKFKTLKADAKERLENRKEIAKDKLDKLKEKRRSNFVTKASDVEEITNADGTTSKISTVSFENTRTTVTRNNTVTKTFSAEGDLINIVHNLEIENDKYSKTSTRVVTVNSDGSKDVKTETTVNLSDGTKKEVVREKSVSSDGVGTGTGTVTVTKADGTSKVYNINMKVEASGEVVVNGSDSESDTDTEVTVTEDASGTATATVVEAGEEVESTEVDVAVAAEGEVTV